MREIPIGRELRMHAMRNSYAARMRRLDVHGGPVIRAEPTQAETLVGQDSSVRAFKNSNAARKQRSEAQSGKTGMMPMEWTPQQAPPLRWICYGH